MAALLTQTNPNLKSQKEDVHLSQEMRKSYHYPTPQKTRNF